MKKSDKKSVNKLLFYILAGVMAIFIIFTIFGDTNRIKKIYYARKVQASFQAEDKKLDSPLILLGFTDIKNRKTLCIFMEKYGSNGKVLDCTIAQQSYKVFDDEASKSKAIAAAEKLSTLLQQNGWKHGDYEVGQWFKDVLNKVDYRPDAYQYKYFGKTYCVLDFFVAYSNPKPPAVQAEFRCTSPELNPPVL